MVKRGTRSFWPVVGTFACIHPITFLALHSLFLAAYDGMSVGKWMLMILLLPMMAFATSITVMPVSLLAGSISAVWSRRTQSTARWVLRSALVSGVAVSFSYIPVYMIVHLDIAAGSVLLVTVPSALIAGAVSAWTSRGWRPLAISIARSGVENEPENAVVEMAEDAVLEPRSTVSRKGSFLGLVLVFTAAGPLIAGVIFALSLAGVVVVAGHPADVIPALTAVFAVTLVLAPLGGISGLIAGIISGLVSRGTLSTRRWLIYSTAAGATASALSVTTLLLVFLLGSSFGFWSAISLGISTMFVLGAVAALACAWICRGFRPREPNFPDAPSASIANPQ